MTNPERSVFVMRTDGAWRVVRDGDRRPAVEVDSRDEAFRQARAIARSQGVGVVELNSSGKAASKNSATSRAGRTGGSRGSANLHAG